MYYTITHLTSFSYSAPISESMMHVRKQPRNDTYQTCLRFQMIVSPRARVTGYRDYLGNTVHHFDVPGRHSRLAITAEALVQMLPPPELPTHLPDSTWDELGALASNAEMWDWLAPSRFAYPSALLQSFAEELQLTRRTDPLTLLHEINGAFKERFTYKPKSTRVDSPIDDALEHRRGVCQDYAHIMIALVRQLGIPCRYVSGYLFHRRGDADQSAQDATHAWIEAFLPGLGWVGFDPTNRTLARERHIRVAVGRDYDDVPPTRGVYKGSTTSTLHVAVRVAPSDEPVPEHELVPAEVWTTENEVALTSEAQQQQQQQ